MSAPNFLVVLNLSQYLMMMIMMIMGSKVNHGARFKVLRPLSALSAYTGALTRSRGKLKIIPGSLSRIRLRVSSLHVSRHDPCLITTLVIETSTSPAKKTSNMQLKVLCCEKCYVDFVYCRLHNSLINLNTWTFLPETLFTCSRLIHLSVIANCQALVRSQKSKPNH